MALNLSKSENVVSGGSDVWLRREHRGIHQKCNRKRQRLKDLIDDEREPFHSINTFPFSFRPLSRLLQVGCSERHTSRGSQYGGFSETDCGVPKQ